MGTGLALTPPDGCYIRVAAKSSLALQFTRVEAGVIDPDYRGELKVLLNNYSTFEDIEIFRGQAVAQIVMERAVLAPLIEVSDLSPTSRGSRGVSVARSPDKYWPLAFYQNPAESHLLYYSLDQQESSAATEASTTQELPRETDQSVTQEMSRADSLEEQMANLELKRAVSSLQSEGDANPSVAHRESTSRESIPYRPLDAATLAQQGYVEVTPGEATRLRRAGRIGNPLVYRDKSLPGKPVVKALVKIPSSGGKKDAPGTGQGATSTPVVSSGEITRKSSIGETPLPGGSRIKALTAAAGLDKEHAERVRFLAPTDSSERPRPQLRIREERDEPPPQTQV